MQKCVRPIVGECGSETLLFFDLSLNLGYLRTERNEKLNMDFHNLHCKTHPACEAL